MSANSVFPLEIQEVRRPGSVYRIDVKCFTSVKDIKDQLSKETKCPSSRMLLYHSVGGKALSNQRTLHDLGIVGAGGVLYLGMLYSTNPQYMILPAKEMLIDEYCADLILHVRAGFRAGNLPGKTDMLDCTGGVYFMKNGGNLPVAVFKPSDEEQGMPNNPKGYAGNGEYGLRPFFKPGEGYLRETASYILDYDGFCNVPPTIMVHCEHDSFHYPRNHTGQKNMFPKLGSLQKFVPSGDTFEDIGHSMVGVLELQKVALLDMRLLNCDRNASNMLAIRKPAKSRSGSSRSDIPRKYSRSSSLGTASESGYGEQGEIDLGEFLDSEPQPQYSRYSDLYSLVPIDHGYCLPSHLRIDELDWAWFHCPHIAVEVQPEIRDYVNSLDIDALLSDLTRQVPVSEDCLYLLRLAHTVIKEGIAAGLTLRDIAAIIARVDEDVPSPLENAIAAAEDNAQRAIEMRAGRRNTTSPSFLKSLLEDRTVINTGSNIPDLVIGMPSGGFTNTLRSGDLLSSPTPVIVKQKSVGSPRSGGESSPPQRIGRIRRVSSDSPTVCSPNDADAESEYIDEHVSGRRDAVRKTRSDSSDTGEDEKLGLPPFSSPIARVVSAGPPPASRAGVVKPFPMRTSPPERAHRKVNSELNLESFGQCSPPPVGPPSEGSVRSMSSVSRSPKPNHQERHIAPQSDKPIPEQLNIGYLSSENIQKLQNSPAVGVARSDYLFRESLKTSAGSQQAADSARTSGSPTVGQFGDYFMKDLSVAAPSAASVAEALRSELPSPSHCKASPLSSPHCSRSNSAFTLHQPGGSGTGSRDRLGVPSTPPAAAPVSTLSLNRSLNSVQSIARSYGSVSGLAVIAAAGGSGSGSNSSLQGLNAPRPRPGDPLFTLQSFDEDYLRNRRRETSSNSLTVASSSALAVTSFTTTMSSAGAGVASTEGVSVPANISSTDADCVNPPPFSGPSPDLIINSRDRKNNNNNNANKSEAAAEGVDRKMSASLFTSDSDFTSHSTGTSYESSWASESPKMSPKVPSQARKSFSIAATADNVSDILLNKENATQRVNVPVRDDCRYSNRHYTTSVQSPDTAHDDTAAGSLCDIAVNMTIPLKGDGGSDNEQRSKDCYSAELVCTDTEGEAEELGSLPPRSNVTRSAVKQKQQKQSPDSSRDKAVLTPTGMLPIKLTRVTSFAAFESPPLYDLPKAERQVTRMRQERRKVIATTPEFQELRQKFSIEMVAPMLHKTARNKVAQN